MSDIITAERFTLTQVAGLLAVHVASVWRWALHGVRGRRLATVMVGGRRFVLKSDLEVFLANDRSSGRADDDSFRARADSAGKQLDAQLVTRARGRVVAKARRPQPTPKRPSRHPAPEVGKLSKTLF